MSEFAMFRISRYFSEAFVSQSVEELFCSRHVRASLYLHVPYVEHTRVKSSRYNGEQGVGWPCNLLHDTH